MRRISLAGLALLAAFEGNLAKAEGILSGHPIVLDGDTLRLNGRVIGLYGIAAPGRSQRCEHRDGRHRACGASALNALAHRIGSSRVSCETRGADQHRRELAVCRVDGDDLAAWMVENGYAIADRHRTRDYVAQDAQAWARRRGLWAGVFDDPIERVREDYNAAVKFSAVTR